LTDPLPELFTRHPGNPILTAADWPYPAHRVLNPGAVRLPGGDTLLLARVVDRRGGSHFTAARSADGVGGWRIDPAPTMAPLPRACPEELWGIEDPRIVWLPDLGRYGVTYTAFSPRGPVVSLALTDDFRRFERRGPLLPPENKNGALFPARFGGRWALLHRPVRNVGGPENLWLSFSPDLAHWGDHRPLLEARPGVWWDADRVGASPPPLPTPAGWLLVYHGVRMTMAGPHYRLGLALLDLDDPATVRRRGEEWVFESQAPYELHGSMPNVVFPCGAVLDPGGGELRLYYGAADTVIALATARLEELLAWLQRQPAPA
jgi:beta-1,4-mannooligosaccharide/beta-1,4-mannosyl-N-acetylglucosamine phosphorylase